MTYIDITAIYYEIRTYYYVDEKYYFYSIFLQFFFTYIAFDYLMLFRKQKAKKTKDRHQNNQENIVEKQEFVLCIAC